MKKEALGQFGSPELILFSFLLFLGCFLGVVVWALLKSNKGYFKKMSQMPLQDEIKKGGSSER